MDETVTAASPNEQVLAQILIDYDAAADPVRYVADQCELHPELADEIRSLVNMHAGGCAAHPTPPAARCRLANGAQVGPFRIVRFLDKGGMGEVYEAHHERLGRNVALKVIRAGPATKDARGFFLREQQVLARLHQTHIVAIYESAVEGDLEYFAMPLIAGVPLHSVVRTAFAREMSKAGGSTPSLAHIVGAIVDAAAETPTAPRPAANAPSAGFPGPAAEADTTRLRLSAAYFRSAVEVMVQVADALQYAHDENVLHRDIKPSNLMIDRDGHCWIIDFGLAGYLAAAPGRRECDAAAATRAGMGTLAYMAPEQYDGVPDGRSDVWALGATLYELLTLRRAFRPPPNVPLIDHIRTGEPTPARELVPNLPADLAAIYRKALRKAPDERYQTPREFADDLRRWLAFQPTVAAPARTPRRVALWARRNKGWAAAVVAAIAAVVAGVLVNGRMNRLLLDGLQRQLRERDRAAVLQQLHQLCLDRREAGWSTNALEKARTAAKQFPDLGLRKQATVALAGLDARVEKLFDGLGASSVAFDATGQRLLIGGVAALDNHKRPASGARVWDRQRDMIVHTSTQAHDGPVAFQADGKPLQLIPSIKDRHAVVLWDVADDRPVREFRLAGAPPDAPTAANLPTLMLSADGGTVAAAFPRPDDTAAVAIWDAAGGDLVFQTVDTTTALAVAPGRALLAQGNADGRVVVRSLPKGEALMTFKADRAAVTCLAFQHDPRRPGGWLLATGDESGTVAVWDCEARTQRCVCRGLAYQVRAVTVSPDGSTLAAVSRGPCKLWDVATGRPLLDLQGANEMTGVAFSLDGTQVASSGVLAFKHPGEVRVWRLEPDRGIRTLRGLSNTVEKVAFSTGEQLLAALARDGRVGVWDLKTGALRHVFEGPKVAWTDSASFAFDPNDRRLVFAGSTLTRGQAVAWDLNTGKETANWSFPPGLGGLLAFHPTGKVLLFQIETRDGKRILDSGVNVRENPPVLRVRDLLADAGKPLYEIAEFDRFIANLCISDDGGTLALVGITGGGARIRKVKVYDGVAGKELWSSPAEAVRPDDSTVYLDLSRSGRYLSIAPSRKPNSGNTLIELPAGKSLGQVERDVTGNHRWNPDMPYRMTRVYPGSEDLISFIPAGGRTPALVLGVQPSGMQVQFDTAGTRFAWGNDDGSVNVADLPEIGRRLAAIGLGW